MSSIIGKFINWLLVPLYTYKLAIGEYGNLTDLYAWIAILLVILTYGLETGFFRFANDSSEDHPKTVYSTCLFSLLVTTSLFLILVFCFLPSVSGFIGLSGHPEYIAIIAVIIAIDAFTALPFAYLRYLKRPLRFAGIKLLFVLFNIILNLFFLVACPWISERQPGWISWFYDPTYGIGYILLANLLAQLIVFSMLIPEIFKIKWVFRPDLLKRMLRYSFPLLILGVAGIMNQSLDKIFLKRLVSEEALGIYGANYKIAVVILMFIQAFRYAYEPFIFAQNKGEDKRKSYADAMKYFIIFGLLIFLGVMFYLDIIRYFISPAYFEGLVVVPIVMMAELFFGVFYNLSLWYKLTDRTRWGTYFTLFGLVISVTINLVFIPQYGYMACAFAAFFCYLCMMLASYFVGQHYYPIKYDLKSIGTYFVLAVVLYVIAQLVTIENEFFRLAFRTVLLSVYVMYLMKKDLPLSQIPYVCRCFKAKR